jgi:hypothetical protein
MQIIDGLCLKSQRIYHTPCKNDYFNEPEFEVIRDKDGPRSYINVLCNNALSIDSGSFTDAYLLIEDAKPQKFLLKRFTGGQKLMLPKYISDKVIISLLNSKNVEIDFDHFKARLEYGNFKETWLFKKPIYVLPTLFKAPR